jgi:hypothetical protein
MFPIEKITVSFLFSSFFILISIIRITLSYIRLKREK